MMLWLIAVLSLGIGLPSLVDTTCITTITSMSTVTKPPVSYATMSYRSYTAYTAIVTPFMGNNNPNIQNDDFSTSLCNCSVKYATRTITERISITNTPVPTCSPNPQCRNCTMNRKNDGSYDLVILRTNCCYP